MVNRKEIYSENDEDFYGEYSKNVISYHFDEKIVASIKHEKNINNFKYEVTIFDDGIINKIFAIEGWNDLPEKLYEIVHEYSVDKLEVLHYETFFSLNQNFYSYELFPMLVKIVIESGLGTEHVFYKEFVHLIKKSKIVNSETRELIKTEQHTFNNSNLETVVINDLKNPQNYQIKNFIYNEENKLSEIRYTFLKDSKLHLYKIETIKYYRDFTETIFWNSCLDKYYVSKFNGTKLHIDDYYEEEFGFRSYEKILIDADVNEYVNEKYYNSNEKSFDRKKLFYNLDEVSKYTLKWNFGDYIPLLKSKEIEYTITNEKYSTFSKNSEEKYILKDGEVENIYKKKYHKHNDMINYYFGNFKGSNLDYTLICFKDQKRQNKLFSTNKIINY